MTTYVTVITGATSSVLVPFNSAQNAAAAQASLDAIANPAAAAGGIFYKYYIPAATVTGNVTVPTVPLVGGVAQTNNNFINYGLLPGNYETFVNGAMDTPTTPSQGAGTALVVGAAQTTLVSGENATTLYLNTATGGTGFLGGGPAVVLNAFQGASMNLTMDGGSSTVFGVGTSVLTTGDQVGGSNMTVNAGNNSLIQVLEGGFTNVIAQSGTVAVFADAVTATTATTMPGGATVAAGAVLPGAVTVSAASTAPAGTSLWLAAEGGAAYITPGQANAFVFNPASVAGETSATLFGGTLGTMVAPTFTGSAIVLGMNGYFQGGTAGHNIMQSGFTAGAATMVAGGQGDIIFLRGAGDTAIVGDAQSVYAGAGAVTVGQVGDTFVMGGGSGNIQGGQNGYNTFIFTGGHGQGNAAGNYTVAGFHDVSVAPTAAGYLHGSMYVDSAAGALSGAGNITIADFLPQQYTGSVGGAVFDQFSMGAATLVSLTSTLIGGSTTNFNNTAILSDGTTINFQNTLGQVHQVGSFLQ